MKLLFIFLLIGSFGLSQDYKPVSDPSAIKALLSRTAASTNSMSASFTHKTISKLLQQPSVGEGTVLYKKPGKIRWEISSPKKQVILVSGKSFNMQENGKEVKGVGQNKLGQKIQELMVTLFTGSFLNEKEFNIAYFENAGSYRLYMVPKSDRMKKHLSALEMVFDRTKGTMKQLTMVQDANNRVIYTFNKINTNIEIADSKFTTF